MEYYNANNINVLLLGGGWTAKSSGWGQVPFTPQGNLPARGCRQMVKPEIPSKW